MKIQLERRQESFKRVNKVVIRPIDFKGRKGKKQMANSTQILHKVRGLSLLQAVAHANEVLSRPQRNKKPPTFFGEPFPSDLIHSLKKKQETRNL